MTYISQHPPFSGVDVLAEHLAITLGLAKTQVIQIQSTIDRLLQEGHLLVTNNLIKLSPTAEDHVRSVETLSISAWHDLRLQLENKLQQHFGARAKEAAASILPYLGAIASSTGKITAGAFGRKDKRGRFDDHIRQRLLEIDAQLSALGLDEASDRQAVLEKLIKLVTLSTVGRSLVAAELFVYLSGLSPSLLSQAFGAPGAEPTLLIDSNVAMPILANIYHGQAPGQFSRCAVQLYNTIRTHSLILGIPLIYLEK